MLKKRKTLEIKSDVAVDRESEVTPAQGNKLQSYPSSYDLRKIPARWSFSIRETKVVFERTLWLPVRCILSSVGRDCE